MAKNKPPAPSKTGLEAFERFIQEVHRESDRAAIVLGAARLDEMMHEVLKKALGPPPKGNQDELLSEGFAPLGQYSARAQMLLRLQLIDEPLHRALDTVKKIRNRYAHDVDAVLEQQPTSDFIKNLTAPIADEQAFVAALALIGHGQVTLGLQLRAAIVFLCLRLELRLRDTPRLAAPAATGLRSVAASTTLSEPAAVPAHQE